MANHPVTAPEFALHGLTLAANTEEIVTFDHDAESLEVVVHTATAPVYFSVDDSPAVVGGGRCRVLFSGANAAVTDLRRWISGSASQAVRPTKVRLITAGTATVSVLDAT